MPKIKYTTLLDFVLMLLKNLRVVSPNNYISLVSLLRFLNYPASIGETQEIGKYLETRGWAKILFSLGDVKAQITTSGLVYLESKDKVFDEEYAGYIGGLIKTNEAGEPVQLDNTILFENGDDPKKTILNLLSKIKEEVEEKGDVDTDLITDLKVIELEISKFNPDFRLIEIKLNNLTNLTYVSTELQQLKDYLFVPSN